MATPFCYDPEKQVEPIQDIPPANTGQGDCCGIPIVASDPDGNPVIIAAQCDETGCTYYNDNGVEVDLDVDFFLPAPVQDPEIIYATQVGTNETIVVSYVCDTNGVCQYFDTNGTPLVPGVDFIPLIQPESGASAFPGYDPSNPANTFTVQAFFDNNSQQWIYSDSSGNVLVEGTDFIAGEPCCNSFVGQDPATGDMVLVFSVCNPGGTCVYSDVTGASLTIGTDFIAPQPRAPKGSESVVFDDIAPAVLTPPAGANHAQIYVWSSDVVITTDGTAPDPLNCVGSATSCGATLELEGNADLTNFQAIALNTGESGKLWVEYFCVPPVPLANS